MADKVMMQVYIVEEDDGLHYTVRVNSELVNSGGPVSNLDSAINNIRHFAEVHRAKKAAVKLIDLCSGSTLCMEIATHAFNSGDRKHKPTGRPIKVCAEHKDMYVSACEESGVLYEVTDLKTPRVA